MEYHIYLHLQWNQYHSEIEHQLELALTKNCQRLVNHDNIEILYFNFINQIKSNNSLYDNAIILKKQGINHLLRMPT